MLHTAMYIRLVDVGSDINASMHKQTRSNSSKKKILLP